LPRTPRRGSLLRALLGCAAALLAQAAPADAQGGLWRLGLSAGISYSNNVRLRQTGAQRQPRGVIGSTGASLNRTFVGADSAFNMGVHAKALFFRNLSELNRVSSGANLGYTRPLSHNTSLNVSDQFTSSYNTLLDDFANEGVLLPLAGTKRNHAVLDIDHELSARDRMGVSARHDLFFFRNDPDFETDLVDGWRLGGTLHFNHQFSGTKSGSVTFGYNRNSKSANASDSYTTGLGWALALGPRLNVSANAGVSMARSAVRSATRGTGSASLSFQPWRGSSAHVSVFRSMGLGVGLGRVTVREGFSFGMNQTLWRKLHVSISGRQISHGDPFDTVFEYSAQSITVGVKMKVWGSMGIGTSYNYVNRREGRDVSGLRGGLQVSYHTSF
jgi:hypothetical protein